MIWVALLATALILAAVSWGDASSRRALLACAAGILAMQLFKVAGMGDLIWLCATATWVSIGVFVLKAGGRDTAISAILLISSGLCYAAGRFTGFYFSTGNPALLAADILGIIAMLLAGYRGVLIGRSWRVGADYQRWLRRNHSGYFHSKVNEEKEVIGGSNG